MAHARKIADETFTGELEGFLSKCAAHPAITIAQRFGRQSSGARQPAKTAKKGD